MTTAAKPVVLVRIPPPGGTGRHKLTKREAAGGLFFSLGDRYGTEVFNRYRAAAGELRFVAEPSKGQVGDDGAIVIDFVCGGGQGKMGRREATCRQEPTLCGRTTSGRGRGRAPP